MFYFLEVYPHLQDDFIRCAQGERIFFQLVGQSVQGPFIYACTFALREQAETFIYQVQAVYLAHEAGDYFDLVGSERPLEEEVTWIEKRGLVEIQKVKTSLGYEYRATINADLSQTVTEQESKGILMDLDKWMIQHLENTLLLAVLKGSIHGE